VITVVHVIAGLQAGGAESVLLRLVANDRGNRHVVISLTGEGKYGAPLRAAGVTVHALGMPRGRVTLHGWRELRRLLAAYRPDVVQTWMYHADLVGGVAARLARVPRVCWGIRAGEILWTRGQRLTATIRVVNAALSWIIPDRVICNSARAAALHRSIGYSRRKLRVVPNGVDTTVFRPDAARREQGRAAWRVPPGVPLLGAVGRDTPYKDHGTLIAALRSLRDQDVDFRFVFVGPGMDQQNVSVAAQLAAAGLADRVQLCGERDDIAAVMSGLDVCVLSSVAEAFPSVLIESMACGVPCVTTDVGDAAAIVADAGWIVPPRDPAALAAAMRRAIETWRDQAAFAHRQAASRDRVLARFTLGEMIRGFQQNWEGAGA